MADKDGSDIARALPKLVSQQSMHLAYAGWR